MAARGRRREKLMLRRVSAPWLLVDDGFAAPFLQHQMATVYKTLLSVAVDILLLLTVCLPLLLLMMVGQPFQRGFYCSDESIMYPLRKDTIPTLACAFVGLGLPIVFMIIGEAMSKRKGTVEYIIVVGDKKMMVPTVVGNLYKTIGVFLFGATMSQLTTQIAKLSIGRLRPHFLAACSPVPGTYNCSLGYIETFTCRSTNEDEIKEARLSFPSGHSSMSAYCMLYLIIYLQVAFPRKMTLVRPLVQLIAFYLAFYTCLSRISDYKHHWSDVLAGALLGTGYCLVVVYMLSDLIPQRMPFDSPPYKAQDSASISQTSTNSSCDTAISIDTREVH